MPPGCCQTLLPTCTHSTCTHTHGHTNALIALEQTGKEVPHGGSVGHTPTPSVSRAPHPLGALLAGTQSLRRVQNRRLIPTMMSARARSRMQRFLALPLTDPPGPGACVGNLCRLIQRAQRLSRSASRAGGGGYCCPRRPTPSVQVRASGARQQSPRSSAGLGPRSRQR